MRSIILISSLFLSELFMTFYALTGMDYGGGGTSPIFTVLIILSGLCSLFFLLMDFTRTQRTKYFVVFVVILPLLLLLDGLLESSYHPSLVVFNYVIISIGYILPSSIVAIYISKEGLSSYSKYIHVVMLLITLATSFSIQNSLRGLGVSFGTANYQTLSYISALAFCLNLCFILYRKQLPVFPIFDNIFFVYFSYFLLVIQLVGCLISGGRGGFVYLALCSVYTLFHARKLSNLFRIILFSSLLYFIVSSLGPENKLLSLIDSQLERTFSYVSSSGIDMTQTSNRDFLYTSAIQYIDSHLIFGGGLFGSRIDFKGYPHNFFIEILMQLGIFYLAIWLIILFTAFRKMFFLVSNHNEVLLPPVIMYPVTLLLFSGTYLWTPLFWFFITYCLSRTINLSKSNETLCNL